MTFGISLFVHHLSFSWLNDNQIGFCFNRMNGKLIITLSSCFAINETFLSLSWHRNHRNKYIQCVEF